MSIDNTQPLQPTSSVQSRNNPDTSAVRPRRAESKTSTAGTQVQLSGTGSPLINADSQDINVARVEQLKTAIRDGSLKMDSGKIADALIQLAESSLRDE